MPEQHRALIIDDDQGIRTSVERLLPAEEFSVDSAEDGLEGIRKLRTNEYDVVFCDLMMPGLSGFAVLEFVLNDQPDRIHQVIVMTSRAVGESNRICNHDFTGRILRKPFKEKDFKLALQKALRAARRTEA